MVPKYSDRKNVYIYICVSVRVDIYTYTQSLRDIVNADPHSAIKCVCVLYRLPSIRLNSDAAKNRSVISTFLLICM